MLITNEFHSPDPKVTAMAVLYLGELNRCFGSKTAYGRTHPQNKVVFNANVCTMRWGKIWHGDLDLTLQEDAVGLLARRLEEAVYVLYEMDARFETATAPRYDRAVLVAHP
jgi:hypothetical protein